MSYIGNTQQNQNYFPAVDFFSGNGSTTAFTLSRPIASTAAIQVIVSNVAQNPSSAYTVSGNTITFTSAPPSGTNNIYVYYTSPNTTVVQPSQGTVYPSSLSTGGPSWDTAGNLTLDNGAADGAQLVLKSAGYSDWNLDNYSGRLRAYYGGTEYFTINSSGNVGIGTSSPGVRLDVVGGSTTRGRILSSGAIGSGALAYLNFGGSDGAASYVGFGSGTNAFEVANAFNGPMLFYTNNTERMRITPTGNLVINTTSDSIGADGIGIKCKANPGNPIVFLNSSGGLAGYISVNGTATAYNTSSDYRLKENIQPMQNALAVVQQLNPVTYTWKADGSDGQGFIAHELQAVVPDCVTGEKDAVDEEGNPVYQGIDTSFLVATLCKAIQELKAEVDELKAKVN